MNKFWIASLASIALVAFAVAAEKKQMQGPNPGDVAPAFSLQDQDGKTVSLNDYKGKVVVLEWFNNECPFVVKHYRAGNMNQLASKYADKGVVWLAVNSTS